MDKLKGHRDIALAMYISKKSLSHITPTPPIGTQLTMVGSLVTLHK